MVFIFLLLACFPQAETLARISFLRKAESTVWTHHIAYLVTLHQTSAWLIVNTALRAARLSLVPA